MLRVIICVFCVAMAGDLQAGAWPRDKGAGFVSATARFVWPRDLSTSKPESTYLTLYTEYGLTERMTVGLDLGHSVSGENKMVGFVRLPLPAPQDWAMAAELGFGNIAGETVVRPTLSVGRGISGRHGAGWLSLDATVEYGLGTGQSDVKLDATWGSALPRDRKLILQVQSGTPHGEPSFLRLAPSVVTPLPTGLYGELGVTVGLAGNTGLGVLIGLWRDF